MKQLVIAVALAVLALSACAAPAPELELDAGDDSEFVTVSFAIDDETDPSSIETVYALAEECDQALQSEGVGYLDGDGSGLGVYEIFFWGSDREKMWEVIEPIISQAPVPWTSVDLGNMESDEWVTLTPDGAEVLDQ